MRNKIIGLILTTLPCISWGGLIRLDHLSFCYLVSDQPESMKVVLFSGYLPQDKRDEFFTSQPSKKLEVSLEGSKTQKVRVIRIQASGQASNSNVSEQYHNKIAFIVHLDDGRRLFIYDVIFKRVAQAYYTSLAIAVAAKPGFTLVQDIVDPGALVKAERLGQVIPERTLQQVVLLPTEFDIDADTLNIPGLGMFRPELMENSDTDFELKE